MNDPRSFIRSIMRAMIDRYGCYDAVAELFNARWGGGHSKGTLSKKVHGSIGFTVEDVIALEDALGEFPITRMMARRLKDSPSREADMFAASAAAAKEGGEAVAAFIAYANADTEEARALALKEVDEAIEAFRRGRDLLEGGA